MIFDILIRLSLLARGGFVHFIGFALVALLFSGIWNFPYEQWLGISDITGIPLALGFLFAVIWPREVPQDELWAMEIFRAYSRTLGSGLRFSPRLFERIARDAQGNSKGRRSTREFVRDISVLNTITQGARVEEIKIKLRTRMKTIDEDIETESESEESDPNLGRGQVFKNTYALGASIDVALRALTDGVIRAVFGKHQFKYIWDNPNPIKEEIIKEMQITLDRWGEKLVGLDITEIIPTQDVLELLEAPFKAEQEGEEGRIRAQKAGEAAEAQAKGDAAATVLAAEAQKTADIARAEGTKQAEILAGEGVKRKLELEAQGKGIAIKTLAETYGFKEGGDPEANREARKEATNYMLGEEAFKSASAIASNGGLLAVTGGNPMGELVAIGRALAKAVAEGGVPATSVAPTTPPMPPAGVPPTMP